ncbi:MAG: phosphatidylserine decarboxylase family protein [Cyclobacteriaceae bacterium]|nr:phosphatidylserine decarboxylase family protein [Cyclobacteriaceae bacterium]
MTIHREGRQLLVVLASALLAINLLIHNFFTWPQSWELALWAISLFIFVLVLQFFRSPRIITPINESLIYAPADGKVVVIESTRELEYFQAEKQQISIFMSPVDVHINRNPVSGAIKFFKYHAGKYLVAWHPKSSTENERTTLVVHTATGVDILIRQIAGAVARRIKCYVKDGDQVRQGDEFGFIKFGSRVDVFLPLEARIKVKVGDKTRAGKTVLAEL